MSEEEQSYITRLFNRLSISPWRRNPTHPNLVASEREEHDTTEGEAVRNLLPNMNADIESESTAEHETPDFGTTRDEEASDPNGEIQSEVRSAEDDKDNNNSTGCTTNNEMASNDAEVENIPQAMEEQGGAGVAPPVKTSTKKTHKKKTRRSTREVPTKDDPSPRHTRSGKGF